MVIIPSGLTFVATPRTASRAITEALLSRYPDAISDYPKDHHMWPDSVPRDYPIYTVLRNPVYQMISWWHHVDVRHGSKRGVLQFAQEYDNIMFMPRHEEYSLNIYAEIADHFLPYHRDMKVITKALGIEGHMAQVGKHRSCEIKGKEWLELDEYMKEAFPADMKLWEEQCRSQ